MHNQIELILLVILFSVPTFVSSQTNNEFDSQLECIESHYYGTSDLLVNGRNYRPNNARASGHPFYKMREYQKGILYIKDKIFDEVDLLYNIEKDQLILFHELTNSNKIQIVVTPDLVDSFRIGKDLFVHNMNIPGIVDGSIFLKKVYSGNITLYQKQLKRFYPVFTEVNPHGKFGDADISYYLDPGEGLAAKLKNKRDFLNYFKEHKRDIKRFIKQQSIRFSKATDEQLFILMKYCDELKPE